MSLSKLFQRIIWHNNTTPAINEDNLNAMSKAIDDIDDRVILIGDDVVTVIPQIQAYLEQAESIVEAVEELSQNPPYIGANGNWYVFDTTLEAYKDSGVDASITVDIADITMIAEGAQPYVTNTGTNTDPIFHLFLPRSPQGATGNGIANIAKTSTQGLVDTYTITMTDGTTYTFTVTNGQGIGDMTKAVYDSTNAVADAGGIKNYALSQAAFSEMGAKNLLPNYFQTATVYDTINLTAYADGRFKIDGTIASDTNVNILYSWNYPTSAFKHLIGKKVKFSWGNSDFGTFLGIILSDASGNPVLSINTENGEGIITAEPVAITIYAHLLSGVTYNHILYPMLTLASITDSTYEPYALTNQQLTPYALSQSNPNLLDNPWFTVNQRGQSSYSGAVYAVDRWKIIYPSSTVSVTSDGVTLNNNKWLVQCLESELSNYLDGKEVTASLMTSDGQIYSGTATFSKNSTVNYKQISSTESLWLRTYYTDGLIRFEIVNFTPSAGTNMNVRAVKLELGSVSTLAQDTAPNYATELLKCQRYFYRMNTGGGIFQRIGIARASTATAVEPQVKLPTTMRSNPSVTVGGNITAFNVIGNGSSVAASSYSGTRFYGDYKKILFSAASNLVVNELYSIEVASTAETDTTYIDFSADL